MHLPPSLREVAAPPPIPERGGGELRCVHIDIVVHVRPPCARRRSSLWRWLIALMLLALAAHAQPAEWRSYPFGSGTNYYGHDAEGGEWTGRSYDLGGTRYTRCEAGRP